MAGPRLPAALRALARAPLVSIVAIVSLGLGIGANAAIFSVFDHMLLRPLPVPQPGRLVNLRAPGPTPGSHSCGAPGDCESIFSYPMFRDLERAQRVFTGIAAHRPFGANLAFRGETLNGRGVLVSGSYFPVLELQPSLGRLFDRRDDATVGEPRAVVLSHDYWRTRFDARPDVLGQALVVNGQPLTIAGVAPRGFEGTSLGVQPQVFVPMTLRDAMESYSKGSIEDRRSYWAYLFARLRPGVNVDAALASLNVTYSAVLNDVEAPLQKGMSDRTMKQFRARKVTGELDSRGQSQLHKEVRTPIVLLLSVTGLVLLIACANIANLLLARAATRSAEMSVRLAIGASRWRLVRQLLAEAGVLALLGGALGLLVARWTLDLILAMLPDDASRTMTYSVDGRIVAFAFGLTVATGLLFGLFPALHSTRPGLVTALKGQSGQPSGSRAAARFRTALVTAQVGLSMLLLACSGLFVKSLFNVSRVDLGLKLEQIVTFGISPQLNGYTGPRSLELFERLEDELAAIPGVSGASAALVPLLAGNNWNNSLIVEGFPSGPDTDTNAHFNKIAPGYFRTVGIPLLAGREFTRADSANAPLVAIVNEQFTRKFNLGRGAVGRHIQQGDRSSPQIEIVGVVANAKYSEVKDAPPPQYFVPYRQGETLGFLNFYVRTTLDPERLLAAIPKVVARLDPNLPVEDLRTMEQQVRENVFMDRLLTVLSSLFAGLATLLAAFGLYGVLAYTVAQRTREIGLRMALGAAPDRVRGMILRQTAVMTLA
ncbi:MAG: permease, partial [Acidobacteria bacterium]|nr:permease [Acidobacteriota bacterium]